MSELTALLDFVEQQLGPPPIPLHAPCLEEADAQAVAECVRSGFVSSVGAQVAQFEQAVAAFTGASHAVAVVNGTAALMLALKAAGVQPGDWVITQSLTFIATANAIVHVGAEPLLLDVDDSLCLSVEALAAFLQQACDGPIHKATRRRIGAIVPMHTLGFMADMPRIVQLAAEHDIPVIEDAAEALGSRLQGRHAGTFGIAGILSFNGNKLITTGGGGMVLTQDDALAEQARHLATTAKQSHPWHFVHDAVGYNLRLPNLNAALGLSQLQKLPQLLQFKHTWHSTLAAKISALKILGGPLLSNLQGEHQPNYWLQAVQLQDRAARDRLLEMAAARQIQMRPLWTPLHQQPPYRRAPTFGTLQHTQTLFDTVICLPSSPRCDYG